MDGAGDGGLRSIGDAGGALTGQAALEVWRTHDGRVLIHQPGRGRYQAWIEVLPVALPWLVERLQEVGNAPPGGGAS